MFLKELKWESIMNFKNNHILQESAKTYRVDPVIKRSLAARHSRSLDAPYFPSDSEAEERSDIGVRGGFPVLTINEPWWSSKRAHYAHAMLEASRGKLLRRRGRATRTERTTEVSEGE